ncbi:permease component of an ABC superfamily ferric iron transporter [Rahnella aquatilis CIP 78.65 = ATCC 33071]|uniref:ABC-type Fe3+ transport system, permease component n=1 Tax=Rahnella aquatilis (strain ATCC 33071 / DSM 4594 / JCM 1683 / NBRC 105701 / NCIMB 13365 / CIP 78.65) TaxID=745277 RepID=H2J0X4_RAHAC|nr:iron ABC transporter permease [Rahnella aquatilis]AEX52287.1 ABC-type Fe3+ transport system, permease component [Rahnella aquatilis CIP 78.65 = ATCC 33071]KFD09560.1 permease component of an ABC superfamily ferric iron transporter [Rahnella aquatilis CIP 78.65 = ATCC 33071]
MNRNAFLPGVTGVALLLLVALPVTFVVLQAVFPHLDTGSYSAPFSAFSRVFEEPQLYELFATTLKVGLGVALCSGLIGVPLGALRGLFALPAAALWDILFLVPFLLPPYIAALSWMLALQTHGYVQQLLPWLHLNNFLFSLPGMVVVMTLNVFPVVYFAVSRSMAASGSRLADIARIHGAGPWRAFVRITLPMALPAMASSLLLAFTLSVEEYGVPGALGSRSAILMLTTGIEQRLADWPIDLPGAAVLSLMLVAIALCAYSVQRAVLAGKNVESMTGKPADVTPKPLAGWTIPVLVLFTVVALIAVALPVASMLTTAFSRTLSGGLSVSNLTLRHFGNLFAAHGDALGALSTSLSLALGTALIAGATGFLASWLVVARKIRGAAMIDGLSLLPAALPGIVVGVGLILAWNRSFWPVTPYNTWGILLLAYCCLLLPYPVRYVSAALKQIGGNLDAAARVHGATAAQTLRLILLPLVFPSLLASMMMVFAVASRELVTSLLLSPAGVQTVSVYVWRQFEQGSAGDGMAMASVAVLLSLTLMLIAVRLQQRPVA